MRGVGLFGNCVAPANAQRGGKTLCIRLFIYNTLYFRLKLAGSSHILTKFMDEQRRTALIFVTQDVGCASCMCDWGIRQLESQTCMVSIVGFTLTVMNDFRRFLSQFSTIFHQILHTLFSIHVVTTVKVLINILEVRPFDI